MIRIAILVLIAFGLSAYLPVSEREQSGDFNNIIFSTDSSRKCPRMGGTVDPLSQLQILALLLQLVHGQGLRLLLRFLLVV